MGIALLPDVLAGTVPSILRGSCFFVILPDDDTHIVPIRQEPRRMPGSTSQKRWVASQRLWPIGPEEEFYLQMLT
ncbi:hypothetical protein C0J52_01246 [Blattella germanica]|nr:hypothetical protein C0J52_01246 [Blattella germanica]